MEAWFVNLVTSTPAWLAEVSNAVTWPVALIIVIWHFRAEVKSLLTAIVTMRLRLPNGTEVGFITTSQNTLPASNPTQLPTESTTLPVTTALPSNTPRVDSGSNIALQDAITPLQTLVPADELNPVVTSFRNSLSRVTGNDLGGQVEYLLNLAAVLNIQLTHERNYRLIFGTQILLLKKLHELGEMSLDQVETVYNWAVATHSEFNKTYSFANWLGFLNNNQLCQQAGNAVTITAFGEGLLRYMLDRRLSENKPF
jgi:hypothetical protein